MINDLEPFKVLNPSAENLAKYFYDETNADSQKCDQRPGARERCHDLRNRHDHRDVFGVARYRQPGESLAIRLTR